MGTDWTWKACMRPGLASTSIETTWKRPSYEAATEASTSTRSCETGRRCDQRTTTTGTFAVELTIAWKPPSVPSMTSPLPPPAPAADVGLLSSDRSTAPRRAAELMGCEVMGPLSLTAASSGARPCHDLLRGGHQGGLPRGSGHGEDNELERGDRGRLGDCLLYTSPSPRD